MEWGVARGLRQVDCGKSDDWRRLQGKECGGGQMRRRDWGQGCCKRDEGEDRDVGRGMRGGDCGEVDEGKRLWGKGYGERDEVKGYGLW